jgi:hypothetical protein
MKNLADSSEKVLVFGESEKVSKCIFKYRDNKLPY